VDAFIVSLVGKSPFTISYEHLIDFEGRVEKSMVTDVVETDFVKVLVDSQKPGKHIYNLANIQDGNYKSPIKINSEKSMSKTVHQIPSIEFDEPEKIFQCTNTNTNKHKLNLILKGIPPFKFEVLQSHDNQPIKTIKKTIELKDLKAVKDYYEYDLFVSDVNHMGKHEFIVQNIKDKHCSASFEKGMKTISTNISIADQARYLKLIG
jgi:hypothetical protein